MDDGTIGVGEKSIIMFIYNTQHKVKRSLVNVSLFFFFDIVLGKRSSIQKVDIPLQVNAYHCCGSVVVTDITNYFQFHFVQHCRRVHRR